MKKIIFMSLVLSLTFIVNINAYAYNYNGYEYADFPNEYFATGDTLVLYNSSGNIMLEVIGGKVYVENDTLYLDGNALYRTIYKYDGSWTKLMSYDATNALQDGAIAYSIASHIKWSATDIYTKSGALWLEGDKDFFQLWEMVRSLTAETMTAETLPTIAKAMKTIVGSAVLCLALLIGLSLFGKVFHRFQIKS